MATLTGYLNLQRREGSAIVRRVHYAENVYFLTWQVSQLDGGSQTLTQETRGIFGGIILRLPQIRREIDSLMIRDLTNIEIVEHSAAHVFDLTHALQSLTRATERSPLQSLRSWADALNETEFLGVTTCAANILRHGCQVLYELRAGNDFAL